VPYLVAISTPYIELANAVIVGGKIPVPRHALLKQACTNADLYSDKVALCDEQDEIRVCVWNVEDGKMKNVLTHIYHISDAIESGWDEYVFPLLGELKGRSSIDYSDKLAVNDVTAVVAWNNWQNFHAGEFGFTSGPIRSIEQCDHKGQPFEKVTYRYSTEPSNSGGAGINQHNKLVFLHHFSRGGVVNGGVVMSRSHMAKITNPAQPKNQ
jgi:hypothetical protein